MNLPTLNMAGWAIDDYEDAYIGLQAMVSAGQGYVGGSTAGSAFVADVVVDWMDWQVQAIIDSLKIVRFDVPKEDDRRVKLLIRFSLDSSDATAADIVAMIAVQSAPLAA